LEDQEEVVEKVKEEDTLILTKALSEFHDLGEQNESDGAYKPLHSMNDTPRFELKQTRIEYKLQQETSNWTHYLLMINPRKRCFTLS